MRKPNDIFYLSYRQWHEVQFFYFLKWSCMGNAVSTLSLTHSLSLALSRWLSLALACSCLLSLALAFSSSLLLALACFCLRPLALACSRLLSLALACSRIFPRVSRFQALLLLLSRSLCYYLFNALAHVYTGSILERYAKSYCVTVCHGSYV